MPRLATTLVILLVCLGAPGFGAARAADPPKLTAEERKELRKQWLEQMTTGVKLYRAGRSQEALEAVEKALAAAEKLYPTTEYPKGHEDLALTLNNMALLLDSVGEPRKAVGYLERALAMRERLSDKQDSPEMASVINNLAYALAGLGDLRQALTYCGRALAMCERLYGKKDHAQMALALNNMGYVLLALGESREALSYYKRALDMQERLYPKKDHADLASSLGNLGAAQLALGEYRQALAPYERALAMYERLYDKKDHPDLARALGDMGNVLKALGEPRQALPYYERGLAMYERMCGKKDHPDLAYALNTLGGVLTALGEPRRARDYHKRALEMYERLYDKKDHPESAASLNNMGYVLEALGEHREALTYFERALAMKERLYQKRPHFELANGFSNMGNVLQRQGEPGKALPFFERALAMQRTLIAERALSASEAEVFSFANAFPQTRDCLLSACLAVADADDRAYEQVWQGKAQLTRLLQGRHLAAGAARDKQTRAAWEELRQARRDLARLLTSTEWNKEERDKQLRALNEAKENAERKLAELLPAYRELLRADPRPHGDLTKVLPPDAVFLDLIRYRKYDKDDRHYHYAAFVLARGKSAVRVELGEAKTIDDALGKWLAAVDAWKPGLPRKEENDLLAETDRLGKEVATRVWTPLAKHIPGRAVLYLSTDGDLARLPWAALPTDDDRVLLQDHLICQVPHGPFLLERLTTKSKPDDGKGRLLAVGGVDYGTADKPRFAKLPGTATELTQILALAGKRDKVSLQGQDATTTRVLGGLASARYAHLGTHGEFKEDLLRAERKHIADQLKDWTTHSNTGTERIGLGLRSPLSYVGVALAGANAPDKAGPDGGILSGEAVVESQLEGLWLCVLSACETGLGDYTQGEGVQGLVRAFHVAGCPNVVASLWKVNDDATAALMAKFYRELWENGQNPAEALRSAQLLLYTQPDVVGTLARGERGAPDFDKAVQFDPAKAEAPKGKRLPPKLWAAFLLSGTGQ